MASRPAWRERISEWLAIACGAAVPIGLLIALGISLQPRTYGNAASTSAAAPALADSAVNEGAWNASRPVPETSVGWQRSEATHKGVLQIYECSDGGQRRLSDQPCGADATLRSVDLAHQNTYREMPVVSSPYASTGARQPLRAGSGSRSSAGAAEPPKPRVNCASIERQLEWVNARLRAGYHEPTGNRLRAERRRLGDLLEAHCLKR